MSENGIGMRVNYKVGQKLFCWLQCLPAFTFAIAVTRLWKQNSPKLPCVSCRIVGIDTRPINCLPCNHVSHAVTADTTRTPRNAERQFLWLFLVLFDTHLHWFASSALCFVMQLGLSVCVDLLQEALTLFSKAQDLAEAQYHVARCYDHGIGTIEDKTKAVHWYTKV